MKPLRLTPNGPIVVKDGRIIAEGPDVVALFIGLADKYTEVVGGFIDNDDAPGVLLKNTPKSTPGCTELSFPDYPGWAVHCSDVCRYTLSVCLVRSDAYFRTGASEA